MKSSAMLSFLLVAACLGSPAAAQTATPLDYARNQSVFCQGTYALCIKAPCSPIPTIDRLGNYDYDRVSCTCEIENGWSMGPGQCDDRLPVKAGRFVYMISTYSNLFNKTNATLSCENEQTTWAWCYGAPCVADAHAADQGHGEVTCTCPIEHSKMQTLGGNCEKRNCDSLWSAAKPGADDEANRHFAEYMERHNYPHLPQAQMCAMQTTPPATPLQPR